MKTNEVIKQYDVTRKTLLVYENKGLIKPSRDQSGYRDYSEEDLKMITKIILLRKLNISLDDIHKILSGDQQWIKDIEEHYHLEKKRLEVKQSYLHYVHDVINDHFDVNEAICSLDESLKFEEKNESKPFIIKTWFTFIIILFAALIALYSYDFYMMMTIFIVSASIILISLLETHFYKYSSIICKLMTYGLLVLGCSGIYCFFYAKDIVIFKLLLIFSLFVIVYGLSQQKCLKRLYDHLNSHHINIFIVLSISIPIIVTILKDLQIIETNSRLIFFICALNLVFASVGVSIKYDYLNDQKLS